VIAGSSAPQFQAVALCLVHRYQGWILRKITGSHHIYEKPGSQKSYLFQFTKIKI
jgi:predicted RNA binding protein YcfA (HicA-like mRNA interferase family)